MENDGLTDKKQYNIHPSIQLPIIEFCCQLHFTKSKIIFLNKTELFLCFFLKKKIK